MSDQPLTKRQSEVLAFMHKYQKTYGYAPSLRDIGSEFGIKSTEGVMSHLRALKKKGYVVHEPRLSRSYRPVRRCTDVTCPDCGCEIEVVEEIG